jgi:hypothetical protein
MAMVNLCGTVVGASFPKPVSDAEVMAEYETRSEKNDRRRLWRLRLLRLRLPLLPWLQLPLKMMMMSPTATTTATYK